VSRECHSIINNSPLSGLIGLVFKVRSAATTVYQRIHAAFIGQFLAMLLWLAGFKYTFASVAAVLGETASIFILLLAAIWLKEPLTRRSVTGVVLTFGGVCFMLWVR
jgi:drug/metabolite transporter (DMT)-like permease